MTFVMARVDEPSSMKLLAAAAIAVWKATLAAQPQSSLSHAWRSTRNRVIRQLTEQ